MRRVYGLMLGCGFALTVGIYQVLAAASADKTVPAQAAPSKTESKEEKPAAPAEKKEKPEILRDFSLLPEPVKQMRQRILDAAATGDVEKLRTPIEVNEVAPAFSFIEEGQDPIAAFKKASNDGEGRELLAILSEVLEAGYVHVDAGTPQEMYIWPYFARYPLDELTPPQMVELFRLVTAYDFEQMKEFGAYNFYRIGIGPDGTWHYLSSGD